MIEGIVFDLDDTLYPEHQYVRSGLSATAKWIQETIGLPAPEVEAELVRLHELDPERLFDRWVAVRNENDPRLVRELVRVYRTHAPEIDLYPGARLLLRRLQTRYALGLISDGYLQVQKAKFRALYIDEFFQAVVFSDSIGRDAWKPDPRPYESCLRKLQQDPGRTVYVADNPTKDFLGARRVGMLAIRVNHELGYHYKTIPQTDSHGAHVEIDELAELEEAIESLDLER